MIGCEKNAHLFPIKMTSNIQSMYEFPRFSKSSSQFIERMLSYVALGCSPLGLNNCFPILMSFFFFQKLGRSRVVCLTEYSSYWVQSRSPQYQHSVSGRVLVLGLLGTRPPQQEVSCRSLSEASSVLQLLSITLSSPPEGTVQLVFLELFVVTLPMLNRNKNSTNIDDYFSFSVLRMVSQCPSSLSQ